MKLRYVFLTRKKRIGSLCVLVMLLIGHSLTALAQMRSINTTHLMDKALSLLVRPQWLTSHLYDNGLVIVDTRSEQAYLLGHIENAINIPVASTFGDKPHDDLVAPISRIQKLFSAVGIGNDTGVIVYDEGNFYDAARVFWVLEVYGHKQVAMLDGGYTLWFKKGLAVSTKTVRHSPAMFLPTIVPEHLSTKFSTRLAIDDKSKIIIDARSSDEYKGLKSRATRKGHIPSAINIPFSENIQVLPDGSSRIKPIGVLKTIYKNVDRNKKVITYCNRGKQSALTYFILRRLGYNVSAYDGSWLEWSADASLPIIGPKLQSYNNVNKMAP